MSINLTLNEVAQLAHVGWGGFIAMSIMHFHPNYILAALVVIGFAAGKEFIFDKLTEGSANQGNDVEDFLFFLVGMAAALVVWAL